MDNVVNKEGLITHREGVKNAQLFVFLNVLRRCDLSERSITQSLANYKGLGNIL